jgi:Cu2+-exporting ATPase
MDLPVALGLIVAFAASVYSTARGSGAVYFDSVAMFVFLLLGARLLELNARTKAAAAQQRLARLVPATAERLDRYPDTTVCETVPVARLEQGDIVVVRAGNAIPVDGIVIDGASAADEALLTGESRPDIEARGGQTLSAVRSTCTAPDDQSRPCR